MTMPRIDTRRIYAGVGPKDGFRVLIDRLWPRGIAKADAAIDAWPKALAPSTELRKWYGHDPEKWEEFQRRYDAELDAQPEAVAELEAILAKQKRVTIVYASKEEALNNATSLRHYLLERA